VFFVAHFSSFKMQDIILDISYHFCSFKVAHLHTLLLSIIILTQCYCWFIFCCQLYKISDHILFICTSEIIKIDNALINIWAVWFSSIHWRGLQYHPYHIHVLSILLTIFMIDNIMDNKIVCGWGTFWLLFYDNCSHTWPTDLIQHNALVFQVKNNKPVLGNPTLSRKWHQSTTVDFRSF